MVPEKINEEFSAALSAMNNRRDDDLFGRLMALREENTRPGGPGVTKTLSDIQREILKELYERLAEVVQAYLDPLEAYDVQLDDFQRLNSYSLIENRMMTERDHLANHLFHNPAFGGRIFVGISHNFEIELRGKFNKTLGHAIAAAKTKWSRGVAALEKRLSDEANKPMTRQFEHSDLERIFIVHGHDDAVREMVARFISTIGLEPIILHEQANRGMTIPEKLSAYSNVGFAIVLLTPDDVGKKKTDSADQPRARQNVVLELGYFVGKLGRERVCALKKGSLELPSDYLGVVYTEFDEGGGWKQKLGQELQAVGYHIDWQRIMGKSG